MKDCFYGTTLNMSGLSFLKGMVQIILIILACFFLPGKSGAQIPEIQPPDLYMVEVINPEGHVRLHWTHPDVSSIHGYIAYYHDPELDPSPGIPFDTIYQPGEMNLVDQSGRANTEPVPYKIAAFRIIDGNFHTSPQTNPHYTIYTRHAYDTCNSHISLSWSPYRGWENIQYYEVLQDGNPIQQLNDTVFTVNQLPDNALLNFSIRAVKEPGTGSTSNIIELNTSIPDAPAYINADYVTVSGNSQLDFRFTLGAGGGNFTYHLVRLQNNQPSDTLSSFTYANPVEYAYYSGSVEASNVYQLIGECGFTEVTSNTCQNMVLQGNRTDNTIQLSWNEYQNWLGNVEGYNVYRVSSFGTEMIGSGLASTNFTDNITSLLESGYDGEIGYYITAEEGNTNPYNITGNSQSNTIFFTITNEIEFPEAFTPNDDGINDVFRPLNIGFTPASYKLIIYNRYGVPIFESNQLSEGWDGRFASGKTVSEGIYIYYLEYVGQDGTRHHQQGNITVVIP